MNGPRRTIALLAAAMLCAAASPAVAQKPLYKCDSRAGTTYTDRPCTGGQVVGRPAPRKTDKTKPVPQDRALIARRALLSEEDRAECKRLDVRMAEQQAELKAKGDGATLEDEMPMVFTRKRLRELGC